MPRRGSERGCRRRWRRRGTRVRVHAPRPSRCVQRWATCRSSWPRLTPWRSRSLGRTGQSAQREKRQGQTARR
eukprot:5741818-Pleurochrysis_carterae.AAC.1